MKVLNILAIVSVLTLLAACSSSKSDKVGDIQSVEEMYDTALNNLSSKKYSKAIEKFEELERTYPYSKWAIKSEIMSAYASYEDGKYDDAINTLERFTKLHPGNTQIPYAYYLKALCYYDQISDIRRDQGYTETAKNALNEVVLRFPDTNYARDAKLKLDLVVDHLAGKEVEVGRFYLKNGKTIAAINRFKKVVEDYQTTSHVPEALHRLVEAYMSLGVKEEALKYAAVLGHNFPASKWYKYSYKLFKGDTSLDKTSGFGDFFKKTGDNLKVKKGIVRDAQQSTWDDFKGKIKSLKIPTFWEGDKKEIKKEEEIKEKEEARQKEESKKENEVIKKELKADEE